MAVQVNTSVLSTSTTTGEHYFIICIIQLPFAKHITVDTILLNNFWIQLVIDRQLQEAYMSMWETYIEVYM